MARAPRQRKSPRAAPTAEVVRRSDRPVVVAALPLRASAREHLARSLGEVELRDIRDDVLTADLVLAPSCSPQAVAALKRAFPTAHLVVVELKDLEWDVDLPGPIQRLLAAGADGYVAAGSIAELAEQLRLRATLPTVNDQPALVEANIFNALILASVEDLSRRRAQMSEEPRQQVDRE